jgi:protein-disulfide isomerase
VSRGQGRTGSRSQQAARLAAEQAAQRRRDRQILVAALTVLVVLVVGGGVGLQFWRTHRLPAAAVPTVLVPDARQAVTAGQPIRLGGADAPVTIQLFEDFHCPHCVDLFELYPMAFVDAGSAPAANAMACATEAGFGARYHQGLFANHTLLWNDRQLLDLAGKVGASPDGTFASCVTTDAKAAWVDSVNGVADARSVTQTPTMFLDGAPVDLGSLTPESLQSMIDAKR